MGGLVYHNSTTTGHSTYPPTTVISSQTKVFVEGIPVVGEGDLIKQHTNTVKPYDTHTGSVVKSKTSKVFVNGVKAAQIGDTISCGDFIAQASSKVNIT